MFRVIFISNLLNTNPSIETKATASKAFGITKPYATICLECSTAAEAPKHINPKPTNEIMNAELGEWSLAARNATKTRKGTKRNGVIKNRGPYTPVSCMSQFRSGPSNAYSIISAIEIVSLASSNTNQGKNEITNKASVSMKYTRYHVIAVMEPRDPDRRRPL